MAIKDKPRIALVIGLGGVNVRLLNNIISEVFLSVVKNNSPHPPVNHLTPTIPHASPIL